MSDSASFTAASLLRWIVSRALWLLAAAWTLLLLTWLVLHWGILPRIDQWRGPIERQASAAVGVPVRIGEIVVRSSGWVPALELRDVVLHDTEGRAALTLPRVAAAISPRSLLSLEPRFEQLYIEAPRLEVRRDALGRIFVAGIEVGTGPEDGALSEWFWQQGEFVIRGGAVRWTDEKRLAPPLELRDVDLVVRNGVRRHAVRIDATPEAAWGERFSLRGRFTQPLLARAGDWRRWSGSVFADLPRAEVSELRRHVNLPFELNEGSGGVRAWFDIEAGEVRNVTADVALRTVALRLAPQVERLTLEQIQGRMTLQRDDKGGSATLQRFGFTTGDGLRWPEGDLSLRWRVRGGSLEGGELSAQQLDLALMAEVATRVPIGEPLRRLLESAQPHGVVSGLTAQWEGAPDAPRRYSVKASISGLTLEAAPGTEPHQIGRPGLHNATLRLAATEAGGDAQLGLDAGAIEVPGLFDQPLLAFEQFDAGLTWRIEPQPVGPPRVRVSVRNATFRHADAQGEVNASWSTGAGGGSGRGGRFPGVLDLKGSLGRVNAVRVASFMPRGIPEATRAYVSHAVRSGTVSGATVRLRGDLADFPFRTPADGEFRVNAQVEDLGFAYVPSHPEQGREPAWTSPWPAFTQVGGELLIDRNLLEFRNVRGQMGGLRWEGIGGSVTLQSEDPTVKVSGTGRGALADVLRYVEATPVGRWTGRVLDPVGADGPAEVQIRLALPLNRLPSSQVQGSVVFGGNELRLQPGAPALTALRGRVDFTDHGFTVPGATARLLGGDVSLEGGRSSDGTTRFTASGTIAAEALRRVADAPALARLAGVTSGQAGYRLQLGFVGGRPEFELTSSLVGLAIDAPAPLRKPAEAPLPLLVKTVVAADGSRDALRVELGSLFAAAFQRELGPDGPTVIRGGYGVNEPPPLPDAGVAAAINLPQLRWDEWRAFGERLSGPDAGGAHPAEAYLPQRVALRAQELTVSGRRLERVVAGLTREGDVWRANVDATQLDGYLEYRPGGSAGAGRVLARLARLSVPRTEVEQVESLLDATAQTVPALDIVVGDFELRGKKLGRLEVEAVNRESGADGVREWRLNRLAFTMPEARFAATGSWARRRAAMDFRLEVSNSGALLERLGTPGALRGGKGELRGQVAWTGSPLAIDYPSLSGQMNVAMDAGQFLKADPGAVRLLGVLSLQSLPRRLALDFRDVFQEGFAFDSITGDVSIERGVARTNNLRMRGVQAAVLMEGQADVARETQDLRVVVVPEINAGTASLAWAAINPAVGIGTFLAQLLLRRPLTAANTREFHVSGSWADPKVEKIERAPGESAPDVDAPLPPAPVRERTPAPTPLKEPG